jgi:hypothetical protein
MYKLLIIFFIVFISIFYCFYYRNEGFTDKIESNKNIFINNGQKLNIDNINIRNICIKDGDETECISKEELFNTLNLPLFRKHAICIEDACITRNNLKKINGETEINLKTTDDKCVELDNIPGTLSIRQQARWETDRKGLRDGDLNAGIYHSLYEPEGGWVLETNCGVKRRKSKGGYVNKKYNYGHTDMGVYSKSDAILKSGCANKHSRSPGVCWASAGGKCKRARNNRRRLSKSFYKNKLYNLEVDVNDTLDNIPSLKQNEDCSESNTKFKVEEGSVISDFKNIINPMKGFSYKRGAEHDLDHNKVIQ